LAPGPGATGNNSKKKSAGIIPASLAEWGSCVSRSEPYLGRNKKKGAGMAPRLRLPVLEGNYCNGLLVAVGALPSVV
jgi:hypothetical protein